MGLLLGRDSRRRKVLCLVEKKLGKHLADGQGITSKRVL
jgi:hypothetical protein